MEDATEFTKCDMNGSSIDIPIPIPEDVEAEEYVSQLFDTAKLDICLLDEVKYNVRQKIVSETKRVEDQKDDELIRLTLVSESIEFHHILPPSNKEKSAVKVDNFANKFAHLMHSSSGSCLRKLMETEQLMAKEMAHLTRARAWEVEALARECDSVLSTKAPDLHPFQLAQINEKLKQVHSLYACQIAGLIENQRKDYRQFVDRLCTDEEGTNPLDLPSSDFHFVNHNECVEETVPDIDESFTVYIGAQLKSMHNVRLVSCNGLHQLCRPEADSKLQTAMSLYGRTLSGLIMLVRKHPSYHIINRTEFANLCEQTTELHFDTLSMQLEKTCKLAVEANVWRETNAQKGDEENADTQSITSIHTDCLTVGDVYCTKHSNLSQQVIFHIVGDDQLGTTDISSRHPVLNGIRNVIRTADRISLTNLYIPLLLIEHATESTTVAWCIRRAEMVYKCVKGYLMEVCGAFCGGSPNETPHYNIHFVVPNGLSPIIYQNLRSMLPSIFHLVPGVSVDVPTTLR